MAAGDVITIQMGTNVYGRLEEFRISSGVAQGTWFLLSISGTGSMFNSVNDFIDLTDYYDGHVHPYRGWQIQRVVQQSVTIGSLITTIAKSAFAHMGEQYSKLTGDIAIPSIYIGGNIKRIGSYAFQSDAYLGYTPGIGQISIITDIEYIEEGAFYGQSGINGLRFRNTVKYCEAYAFHECNDLYYVDFADDWEAVNGGGSIFYNCYKLNVISPHNMIVSPRNRNYYNCRYLTRMTIADPENFGINYTNNGLYVELNTGNPDYLDPEGYLITEVAGLDSISGYDWETIWKNKFNRIYVVYVWHDNKVYLAHEGRWIEITMYESGDIPLAHEDVWWFLKWTQGVENPNHTPLYVAHNGHWYQVNY